LILREGGKRVKPLKGLYREGKIVDPLPGPPCPPARGAACVRRVSARGE